LVDICRNGHSWRALPEKFGKRHTIYVRFSRQTKAAYRSRSPSAPAGKRSRNKDFSNGFDVGQGAPKLTRC
ncbi:transposase, partial [Treponema endosymbiont of Eucomonympha sp.]